MPVMYRLPQLAAGVLLCAAAPFAAAESPTPEPLAPAVIGRPLDQIRPQPMQMRPIPARVATAKPAAEKPAAAKPNRPKQEVAARKPTAGKAVAVAAAPATAPAARTAAAAPATTAAATAAAPTAAPAAAPAAAPVAVAAAVPQVPAAAPAAKQAVDDRPDASVPVEDNVGQGSHLARKRLAPGAYIGSRHQAVVRMYYETHPVKATGGKWQIGEPVPPKASLTGVPDDLRAALPVVPPGHQYVQVDGEVVLLAVQSRMVVDGVSRSAR
jgi:Ni/Co efflux regulator RcnB